MSTLGDRLRREREAWVEAGGHEFRLRRPALLELSERAGTRALVCRCVVDWRRVTERDLVAGGADRPLPFDADACEEWLSDRPDLFAPVLERLEQMIAVHAEARQSAEKNSG